MRVLPLLLLAAFLCVSCGKSEKTSSSHSASSEDKLTIDEAIETLAEKAEQGKAFLAADKIRSFDIAGMRLGMTQAEAEARLQADQWQGKFATLSPDISEESSAQAFEQDGKGLFLFRHRTADGSLRIGEIQLIQRYELDHLASDISAALIKKYGTPTIDTGKGLVWRIRHEAVGDRRDPLGDAPASHVCRRTADTEACLKKLTELDKSSRHGPELRAQISAREVKLSLRDPLTIESNLAAVKAQSQKAEDAKRKQNGDAEKVSF